MPRPKRYTLEEITSAIDDESERQKITRKLGEDANRGRTGRPPGRPPEDDDERLLAVACLVLKGNNPHAAANQVTAHLPKSKRAAVAQRLRRKFSTDADSWIGKAALIPITIQEEIEHLRQRLGPGADRFDYRKFLRRIQ